MVVILLILALLGGTVTSLILVNQSATTDPLADLPVPVIRSLKFSDFRGQDLGTQDFRGKDSLIPTFSFDSATKWPSSPYMPSSLDPGKILEQGKYLGLGLSKLHQDGFTGKGISVAMIGRPIRKDHREYGSNLVYIPVGAQNSSSAQDNQFDFQSAAMAGILAGKNGIAPDARLYYYAADLTNQSADEYDLYQEVLARVSETNKGLSEKEKIKVLLVPFWPDPYGDTQGYQKVETALKDLQNQGVVVVHPDMPDFVVQGAGCLPSQNRDDPGNYQPWSWDWAKSQVMQKAKQAGVSSWESFRSEMVKLLTQDEDLDPLQAEAIQTYVYIMAMYRDSISFSSWFQAASDFGPKENALAVPCDYLTVADQISADSYAYIGAGPMTFCLSYVAGVMALGLQANPGANQTTLTNALMNSATSTAQDIKLINPEGFIRLLSQSVK